MSKTSYCKKHDILFAGPCPECEKEIKNMPHEPTDLTVGAIIPKEENRVIEFPLNPTGGMGYTKPKADGGGLRYNTGKNQLELLPAEWVWGLGMVMTRGAIKYDTRNWERGMKWSYPIGCALRHIFKFVCGERYDVETGCHHLAMAAWNVLALMSYDIRGVGENDLVGVGDLTWLDKVATNPGPALQKLMDDKAKK